MSGAPQNFPDVVFGEDLDPFANEITSDLQGLEQDVRHLIEQVLGSNLDDVTKGVGIETKLSGTIADLMAAADEIDSQLAGDDRIDSSTTTLTQTGIGEDGEPIYLIDVEVVVAGSVQNLSFAYTPTGGLQAQ